MLGNNLGNEQSGLIELSLGTQAERSVEAHELTTFIEGTENILPAAPQRVEFDAVREHEGVYWSCMSVGSGLVLARKTVFTALDTPYTEYSYIEAKEKDKTIYTNEVSVLVDEHTEEYMPYAVETDMPISRSASPSGVSSNPTHKYPHLYMSKPTQSGKAVFIVQPPDILAKNKLQAEAIKLTSNAEQGIVPHGFTSAKYHKAVNTLQLLHPMSDRFESAPGLEVITDFDTQALYRAIRLAIYHHSDRRELPAIHSIYDSLTGHKINLEQRQHEDGRVTAGVSLFQANNWAKEEFLVKPSLKGLGYVTSYSATGLEHRAAEGSALQQWLAAQTNPRRPSGFLVTREHSHYLQEVIARSL